MLHPLNHILEHLFVKFIVLAEKKTENLSLVRYCKKIVLLWGKCYTKGGILTNDKEKRIITIILL